MRPPLQDPGRPRATARGLRGSRLGERLLTAAVGTPLVLGVAWAGGPWLVALAVAVALLAVAEFYRLAGLRGHPLLTAFGLAWAGGLAGAGAAGSGALPPALGAGLALGLLLLPLARREGVHPGLWGLALAGPLYVGWPLAHALLLRSLAEGRGWLLLALVATFATDTCAFLVGRALGRHPLAPSISPAKTWEGALGGLAGGLGATVGLGLLLHLPLGTPLLALLGVGIAVAAQLGDLAESAFKRSVGVGEAGRLLPGHGGLLDRLDSLVLTLLLVYHAAAPL